MRIELLQLSVCAVNAEAVSDICAETEHGYSGIGQYSFCKFVCCALRSGLAALC